jgi:hypothetical protein
MAARCVARDLLRRHGREQVSIAVVLAPGWA